LKRISDILIVSSTKFEVNKIIKKFNFIDKKHENCSSYTYKNFKIDVLISGIGIPNTSYYLTKTILNKKYDLIINIGICGSFNSEIKIGDVVNVIEDEFADVGITKDDNSFSSLFEEGFISENDFPYSNAKLVSNFTGYKNLFREVKGITVNSTSGNEEQINMRKAKFNADIETMEGAMVAYTCLSEDIKFIQIRSVSNFVEIRNKTNWDVSLAIENLSILLVKFLTHDINHGLK